ncbi:MAG: hypothetical protein WD063_14035 [Pirellulales bacterium]
MPRALYVMRPDGSDVRHVVSVEGFAACASPRWSHDGQRLVFDADSGKPEGNRLFMAGADGKELVAVGPGSQADWSPDDKQFAFSGGGKTSLKPGIWVQNVNGRAVQWLAPGSGPRWSPDGSQIALVADGLLHVLDQIDSSRRAMFDAGDKITDVRPGFAWSPDGTQLAAAVKRDGAWEVVIVSADGSKSGLRTRLKAKADSLSWSPNGKTLAAALWNEKAREHRLHLLDVDGDAPREIPGQQGDNREPAWSPDGKQLAFASSRPAGDLRPATVTPPAVKLEQIAAFDCGGTCYSLALAPDGRTALLGANMGNRRLQVWDVHTQVVERAIPMLGIFVAVSPDGKHAACTERFKKAVTLFNLEDGQPIRDLSSAAPIWFVEFSAGGSRLVCGAQDGTATVFDVRTGKELVRLTHKGRVATGALSPDGSIVAVSAADNKVHVWDVAGAKETRQLDHPDLVWCVAFSPDGRLIATGTGATPTGDVAAQRVPAGDDNAVRLWDAASGRLVRELKGHGHAVASVAFSPDSRRLATGSFDGTLRLWDVERGTELCRASGKSWIFKVVYSPDAELILASGGNAREKMSDRRLVDYPAERVRVFKIAPLDETKRDGG